LIAALEAASGLFAKRLVTNWRDSARSFQVYLIS
jgi:hypothetical protein